MKKCGNTKKIRGHINNYMTPAEATSTLDSYSFF